MKQRVFFLLLLAAALCFSCLPDRAVAQTNYYNAEETAETKADEASAQGAKSFTVTSIEKCYASLGREDALDIQRNFIKPYQECQRRLAIKLKKIQAGKAAAAKDPVPEPPKGFYRVQKEKPHPPEKPSENAAPQQ